MLSLVLKFLLAVLQALPQVLEAIQSQMAKKQREKRDAEIENDPLTEFEHKFGKLQPDPAEPDKNPPLQDPPSKFNTNDSPGRG